MTQVAISPTSDTSPRSAAVAAPPARRVELNAFQILMKRWSKLHPYNAGQVMEVSGRADMERWKGAITAVLGEMGLGPARFEKHDRAAMISPAEEIILEKSGRELNEFFNVELNRPFDGKDAPIRFSVLTRTNGEGGGREESHYLAAVYDHWIADSRAMRELMHRLFEWYQNPEGASRLEPLTLKAPKFTSLFRHHIGYLTRSMTLRESVKNIWRHRKGYRINIRNPLDLHSHILIRRLPEGLIDRVHQFAKARGASVNDVFIALLAQTMGGYTAEQRLHRRKKLLHFPRRQVGIGTIVDIRDAANEQLDHVFNLYLSSYTVMLSDPENLPVDQLTRQVARKTSRLKRAGATVRGFFALAMARFWWDLHRSPRYQSQLLHKMVPVVAGISNVKMTGSWVDDRTAAPVGSGAPRILDYLRISPTGPLIPLVFTLTTIGGRLSLCVTYRTTAFTDKGASRVVDEFVSRLETAVA